MSPFIHHMSDISVSARMSDVRDSINIKKRHTYIWQFYQV
jgi:hypothetical protein